MNRTVTVFEFARELAWMHARSAPGKVTVIPVLVDDLAGAMPVLEAFSSVVEGTFLDASAPSYTQPVEPTADAVRRSAVEHALGAATLGAAGIVFRTVTGGKVDAQLGDSMPTSALSQGEQTALSIARAVIHADMDERELAMLLYSESSIDLQYRRAVWNLITRQFTNVPHPILRTLVVVVEGVIDIAQHCQTSTGFRLAIQGERLVRRHGADDLHTWTARFARSTQPFVLFLGAGFSASSRLPLGNGLRDTAIRRLLGMRPSDAATSDELAARFHAWIIERPYWLTPREAELREDDYVRQLTLEQVLRAERLVYPDLPTLREFRAHHDAVVAVPGPAVLDLAEILARGAGRLILAGVNFDRLVEIHSTVPLQVFSDPDFAGAADYVKNYLSGGESTVPYLKVHGSIENEDSCIVTADQTELGVKGGKLETIRALLLPNTKPRWWIYVGASMRDKDLLRVFNDSDFASGTSEVWVSPFLPDTVEEYAADRAAFWQDSPYRSVDDRLISETADAFFGALRSAWDDSAVADKKTL